MDEKKNPPPGRYLTTVKVGPKGQIVIPKEARELCQVAPGDRLLLVTDEKYGIGLLRAERFDALFGDCFWKWGEGQ